MHATMQMVDIVVSSAFVKITHLICIDMSSATINSLMISIIHFRNHFGFEFDMLKNAAQSLNFTFTIENSPDMKWLGLDQNASWNGLMGQASKNIVDFSIGALPVEVGSTQVICII